MRSDGCVGQQPAPETTQDASTPELVLDSRIDWPLHNAWLSAREWLAAYRKGTVRVDEGPLRFLSNGERAEESIVDWAIRRNVPETQLAREIRSRQWFAGSSQARDKAVEAVRDALERMALVARNRE